MIGHDVVKIRALSFQYCEVPYFDINNKYVAVATYNLLYYLILTSYL